MAYFPFPPISYNTPERERFAYSPYATPAPGFTAPARNDEMPAWAAALMQAGAGVLSADPRKGFAGALGEGISSGLKGYTSQVRSNDDTYDRSFRRARDTHGDERETWKLSRDDHNTGQRFAADDVRDTNRYSSEDAGRSFEAEKFNSKGILDSKIAGDQSSRGWANHGLSKERLTYDRTKDARDFEERQRIGDRDFSLRSNSDRRAQEQADLARQQPEVKVNAWGEGVVIPRNEQGVFDVDAIKYIGNPNGGRTAAGGAGTKVTLDKVDTKAMRAFEGHLANALGASDGFNEDGVPIAVSGFAKLIPPEVLNTYKDAAAGELARTGNMQAAVRVGMEAAGIPRGSKRVDTGLFGWGGGAIDGPDGKPLGLGARPPGVEPPAPAPSRTQIVPRGGQVAPPAPAPMPTPETMAAPTGHPTPTEPASQGIPPVEKRVVGQEYTAPNGRTAKWTLNGWQLVK